MHTTRTCFTPSGDTPSPLLLHPRLRVSLQKTWEVAYHTNLRISWSLLTGLGGYFLTHASSVTFPVLQAVLVPFARHFGSDNRSISHSLHYPQMSRTSLLYELR